MMTNPRRKTTVRPLQPKSVAAAAATGDERQLLIALRDTIAQAISDGSCPPRDLASLSRRLLEVSRELSDLDVRRATEEQPKARRVGSRADEAWREL
jgi:hypothetical protein